MAIVELDPAVAWKAVEGYQNELAPDATKLEALYRQVPCPRCGQAGHKEFNVAHAFADKSTLVPRALLRCANCQCLYNPHSLDPNGRAMIVERGEPGVHL
jgi:rubredoxin